MPNCSYQQKLIFVEQSELQTPRHAQPRDGADIVITAKEKTLKAYHNQAAWYVEHPRLTTVTGLTTQWDLKDDYVFEDNIRCIMHSYTLLYSPIPVELDPSHNQICGAWIGALPLIPTVGKRKPFLPLAIRTLATILRTHRSGKSSQQSLVNRMYSDSLRHMGQALEDARGVFQVEHCVAIMCLAVSDVSLARDTVVFVPRTDWNCVDIVPNAGFWVDDACARRWRSDETPWSGNLQ